jgi:hypothetical protein
VKLTLSNTQEVEVPDEELVAEFFRWADSKTVICMRKLGWHSSFVLFLREAKNASATTFQIDRLSGITIRRFYDRLAEYV